MTGPLLDVRHLAVSFGPTQAVKWASFTIERGQILGIVGESGSGKSTLLWALTRLSPEVATINSGEVFFEGQDLLRLPKADLNALRGARIAYISQDPMTSLAPGLTIGQQMVDLLHREPWSKAEKRARCIDVLNWVHMPDPEARMGMYPHQLSGGQRQRVSIAMALMLGPDLVLADEPTTALDPTLEVEILHLLKKLQRETGCSVIFVTHHLGVVASLCEEVLVMKDGEICEAGPVSEVFSNPQDAYTQRLLECDPARVSEPSRRLPTMSDADISQDVLPREDRIDMSGQETLHIRDLNVRFHQRGLLPVALGGWHKEIHAVQDVSLEIRRGETLAVIGESGSGKSTIARCIVGLVTPDSGVVKVNGQQVPAPRSPDWKAFRARVGTMFQDPTGSLSPRVSIGEQIVEPLKIHGRAAEATPEKAAELLTVCGLDSSFAARFPHELSGGQARRAGVARALALDPDLIVADEPTAGLDVSVQGEVLNLLNILQEREKLAILLITHNMSVVRHTADRTLVLLKGETVEYGPTADIFANPKQDYTRALIAASQHELPNIESEHHANT